MSHFWTIFEPIFERFAFGNSIWPVSKLSKKAADVRTNGRTDEHTSIFEAPLHNRPWRAIIDFLIARVDSNQLILLISVQFDFDVIAKIHLVIWKNGDRFLIRIPKICMFRTISRSEALWHSRWLPGRSRIVLSWFYAHSLVEKQFSTVISRIWTRSHSTAEHTSHSKEKKKFFRLLE